MKLEQYVKVCGSMDNKCDIDKFLNVAKKAEDEDLLSEMAVNSTMVDVFAGAMAETYHQKFPFNGQAEFDKWVDELALSLKTAFHEGLEDDE